MDQIIQKFLDQGIVGAIALVTGLALYRIVFMFIGYLEKMETRHEEEGTERRTILSAHTEALQEMYRGQQEMIRTQQETTAALKEIGEILKNLNGQLSRRT